MSYKEISLLGDSIGQGHWDQSGIGWFGCLSQKIGAAYNAQVADLCTKYSVPHFNTLFDTMKDRAGLYHDATHPNAAGHRLMAEQVSDFLVASGWFDDIANSPSSDGR